MQLIAVIMGAQTRDDRNEAARALLDYGFANYALYERGEEFIENAHVLGGRSDSIPLYSTAFSILISKSELNLIELEYEIPEEIAAPISMGSSVGKIIYSVGGKQIGSSDIISGENVDSIGLGELFARILKRIVCG